MKKTLFISLIGLVLIGASCSSSGFEGELVNNDLTVEEILNAEYYSGAFSGKIKLEDGHYYSEEDDNGFILRHETSVYQDEGYSIAFGDLTGNGKEDAAVIIASNFGGTGVFIDLVVFESKDGKPVFLDSLYLGDRYIVNSITIETGEIILNMVIHGPDDPFCCPSVEVTERYNLSSKGKLGKILNTDQ